ncbi:MAG: hypothetical protein HY698_13010, partial [Deltaproteobacteria bacterium]|nr:hypothetical protein [Deltaproteobacteria bacterium]
MQPIFDIASKTKVVLIALISLIASPVPTSVVRQPTSAIGQLRELDRQALGAEDAHYAAEYRFQDALAAMMVGDRPVSDGDLAVFKRDEETARSAMEASHQRRDEFVTLLVAHAQDGTTTVAALAALLVDLGKTRNEVKYRSISSDLLDESCVDVLRGQVLFDLSEAVESNDPAKYARALATLGGSTGCMSLMADLRLGADLLTAYERAIERFAEAKKEDARRALVSALANVFMLIQDDVKHVGLNHAHYWLSANRDELVAAFSRSWSIPRRVGLWFKNQTGTRLEPMRPMCESGARDCASATGLLDAMIEGKRIGLGTCDALELASVPWNPSKGYSCDRGLCAGGDGAGLKGLQKMGKEPVPFTPPMKRDAEGYSIPPPGFHVEDGYLEARESLFPKEGHTRYGTEIASLQASLCSSDETSNGSSGVRSFSSKKCAQSMLNASAKGKTLAKLRCVNEVKQRSAEMALNFDAWPMDTCVASVGKNDGEKDNIKPPPSNSTYDKEKL